MKKFLLIIVFLLFNISQVLAFDIQKLQNCKSLAVKHITTTDSLHKTKSSRTEIEGVKALVNAFGDTDEKQIFNTDYLYLADDKEVSDKGSTTWYGFGGQNNKRKRYNLYYQKNDMTLSMMPGDTVFLCIKEDQKLLFLSTERDSKIEQDILDFLGLMDKKEETTEKEDDVSTVINTNSWIEIYFTPSTECEDNIIKRIKNAKKIDIAVYSINNNKIFYALLEAKDRGADIHIISDKLQAKGKSSLVDALKTAGFDVRLNKKTKIEHNKFAVFDNKSVVTGSYNWTNPASKSNSENCVFFDQPHKEFSNRFAYLWKLYEPVED